MTIPPPLSADIIFMLLFLAKFLRAIIYLLGIVVSASDGREVTDKMPCIKPLLNSESDCL